MTDYVQVLTATETREQAMELARPVVAPRLAAGAQIIGPMISALWHQGEFRTGEKWQLLLKTRMDKYAELYSNASPLSHRASSTRKVQGRSATAVFSRRSNSPGWHGGSPDSSRAVNSS
ncbi:divalent-cation tolerance protein CutA [Streptomyces sp. PSKA54]|uniref:Divalent-cation tolerance protein CutA n=1 Tax=Streptomyces himalayensis subsp. aureolus TaxID=2758039 RepID=A0A7W2D838_9ACTN|nr:divalent cation tolerance protein CutA [Streptomyces himalayensis]MBA4866508.1 divalent-cation tolerance protein CutA [Streptomyces himalayensis subsp. aureolus]